MRAMRVPAEAVEDLVAQQLVGHTLKQVERALVVQTLIDAGGNRTRAAVALGISVRCLRDKIRQLKEQGVAIPEPYH